MSKIGEKQSILFYYLNHYGNKKISYIAMFLKRIDKENNQKTKFNSPIK